MLNNSTILFSDCKELGLTRFFFIGVSLQSKAMVTASSCVVDHFCDSIWFLLCVCATLVTIYILSNTSKCEFQK